MDNFPSVPGDPEEYPNHDLDVRTDVVSLMYDENLLHLSSECIAVSRQALDTLNASPEVKKDVMEEEGVAWLRNYLMQIAKRTAQHAAGCLDFFELRPPRDETSQATEELDRLLLHIGPNLQKVYRGLLFMLKPHGKYVPLGSGIKKPRVNTLACAVVDAAVSHPGIPIQIPVFDHNKMDVKTKVNEIVRHICKPEPDRRNWFRLEKTAIVRPYADGNFTEYHIYALTFQEPMKVENGAAEKE